MKLEDARANYYTFSSKLSDVNRQLAFAGIAVVWVFVVRGPQESYEIPHGLLRPLIMFVVGLGFDLGHYISSALIWGLYHRFKEVELNGNEKLEFRAPAKINWPAISFFWLKVTFIIFGYALLLHHLWRVLLAG